MKTAKRILTGDRPTGPLHIGHLFGSLQNRVRLQNEGQDVFYMVADVQALTDNFHRPERVRENVREVVLDNLAVGLDPKKSTIFIQSLIPEIAELTVFFSNLVTVARLQRNPTVKNEIAEKGELFKKGNVTFGFLGYPVSQAADIAFAQTELVPVGEDQLPVIEQAREIVRKFHSLYGEGVFVEPEALLSEAPRILGLDGNAKMSKSLGNAIYLRDDGNTVRRAIMKATTDSGAEVRYDVAAKPEVSNLLSMFSLVTGRSVPDLESEFEGAGYGDFKSALADAMIDFLRPIRERREELASEGDQMIDEVLQDGVARAREVAGATMARVREHMKIDYFG